MRFSRQQSAIAFSGPLERGSVDVRCLAAPQERVAGVTLIEHRVAGLEEVKIPAVISFFIKDSLQSAGVFKLKGFA